MLQKEVVELKDLAFLKKLNLSKNELGEIWSLPRTLEALNVSHNNLTSIGESISEILNLKTLDVSHNNITDCTAINTLINMQIFKASYNNVYNIQYI